ncbi:MAG: PcfB family protein [Clostridia bacterium]|nr:PcfB family protein [Clostridia bacterium]
MISEKAVELSTSVSKMTMEELIKIVRSFLSQRDSGVKHGEQSLARLNEQNRQLEDVAIDQADLKVFRRELKRYGVDFALKRNVDTNNIHVFFKSQDVDRVNIGLKNYINKIDTIPQVKRIPLAERIKNARERAAQKMRDMLTKQKTKEFVKKKAERTI